MSDLYTCHKCKHEFDLIPPMVREAANTSGEKLNYKFIKVRCPSCYEVYKVDVQNKIEQKD